VAHYRPACGGLHAGPSRARLPFTAYCRRIAGLPRPPGPPAGVSPPGRNGGFGTGGQGRGIAEPLARQPPAVPQAGRKWLPGLHFPA